jgi:exosortase A-associated hydrolase 2
MAHLKPWFETFHGQRLFCLAHEPTIPATTAVLYVPPFAEEANRTRHLAARQARAFAEHGIAVRFVDPTGTGDSAGDFVDATWSRWCAELREAKSRLAAEGYHRVVVWSVRLGCALALDAGLFDAGGAGIFWQPLLSPKAQLRQYLRLRVASGMSSNGRISVSDLEARLASEGRLEIGGYGISKALADEMTAAQPEETPELPSHLLWVEVGPGQESMLPSASMRTIAQWRSRGARITERRVDGDQFWAIQTLGFAPALLEETTGWLKAADLSDTNGL